MIPPLLIACTWLQQPLRGSEFAHITVWAVLVATWLCHPGFASEYVEIPGARCKERVGDTPIGHRGGTWTDYVHIASETHCDSYVNCTGFMRFLGEQAENCWHWCGRPQFCSETETMEYNSEWVSYIKLDEASKIGVPERDRIPAARVKCDEFGRVSKEPVFLLTDIFDNLADSNSCNVLHRDRRKKLAQVANVGSVPVRWFEKISGELVERQDGSLEYIGADIPSSGGPWRYFFDATKLPHNNIGAHFGKSRFMSVFYTSRDAYCIGPKDTHVFVEHAEEDLPGHVYVDDGTPDTLQAAFQPYTVSLICGNFRQDEFPPKALIAALAYDSHPVVSADLHKNLSRIFFHMPDAVQGYSRADIRTLRRLLHDVFHNPEKAEQAEFKTVFTRLATELVTYRYRAPVNQRAAATACVLCDAIARKKLRDELAAHADAGRDNKATVEFVFCSMSRRNAVELRHSVRSSWATLLQGESAALRFFVGVDDHPLEADETDVVELPIAETYRTINVKAFMMLEWAFKNFPNMQWLLRHDDDVYLRPMPVLAQLRKRPPVRYLWGSIDHGSAPIRDPEHPHYNSEEQCPKTEHPVFGDVFPPYARGHLWAMSADLLAHVVRSFWDDARNYPNMTMEEMAQKIPHPDDPALGIVISNLVHQQGLSVNLDDRDFNVFSLNPSCNHSYSNIHERTWVVHHVSPAVVRCMWEIDIKRGNPFGKTFPDLCPCSQEVPEEEEPEDLYGGTPFSYPRDRFNEPAK